MFLFAESRVFLCLLMELIECGLRMITGFGSAPLAACCGGDGPYNVNSSAKCGTETARVCSDPSRYISWDGIHFTEAAYRIIAAGLMSGSFTVPPINHLCPDLGRGMNTMYCRQCCNLTNG